MATNKKKTFRAPKHLSRQSAAWWRSVMRDWDLEPHHEQVLTACAETLDRIAEARAAIEKDGAYIVDRYGQLKPHPALSVERLQRLALVRLLKPLDLEEPEPARAASRRRH
jgi:phage terminase small subunit